jgi:LPS-assembly lipoprotein
MARMNVNKNLGVSVIADDMTTGSTSDATSRFQGETQERPGEHRPMSPTRQRAPFARRTLLLAGASALLLSACGFELRRAPSLQFSTIQLRGFGRRSEMGDELRRNINASTATRVVESAADAQVVLETQVDAREKVVEASTAAGQVREVTLRNHFTFRVRTPSGTELIPTTEIILTRDMSYNETYALAKEQEETVLYRAMQSDIVAQVMRRLAALRLPA